MSTQTEHTTPWTPFDAEIEAAETLNAEVSARLKAEGYLAAVERYQRLVEAARAWRSNHEGVPTGMNRELDAIRAALKAIEGDA